MSSRTDRLGAAAALLLVLAGAAACAPKSLRHARVAEQQQDYDRAVVEYQRALRERPNDPEILGGLERARLRAAERHFAQGRRLTSIGKLEEGLLELRLAGELNPSIGEVQDEIRRAQVALRNQLAVSRDGKTRLETIVDLSREQAPPGMELPDVKLPASLVFRDASARDVVTAIARFAGLSVVFDPAYRDAPVTIDLRNLGLDEALTAVTASIRSFFRVTAPGAVTIVPDTPAKRREYEEEVVRTFYLSNIDVKEAIDLLRIVVDLRRLAGIPGTNALTIKDSPERVTAAGRVIAAIDKARPEVVIDIELLEVNRTRLKEYGLQVASPDSPGISGVADINRQGLTLETLRNLSSSDVFLLNVPGLYYRLLKSDTNTRTLANPQLRTSEGIAARARFGERVPVPVTTFTPIATGGTAQQPITSFNYENIGVNIDIQPRTHHNDDVTLVLKVEVSSISGTGFGGLPTFGNREIETAIRLRDGETNVLAGLIRDEERTSLDGLPGLSDIPLIRRLFGRNRHETLETDIIMTLTPRIIRVLDLSEEDLRAFRVGREAGSPLVEVPVPQAVPPRDRRPQDDEEGAPPAAPPGQRPVRPILPPSEPPPQPPPPQR